MRKTTVIAAAALLSLSGSAFAASQVHLEVMPNALQLSSETNGHDTTMVWSYGAEASDGNSLTGTTADGLSVDSDAFFMRGGAPF